MNTVRRRHRARIVSLTFVLVTLALLMPRLSSAQQNPATTVLPPAPAVAPAGLTFDSAAYAMAQQRKTVGIALTFSGLALWVGGSAMTAVGALQGFCGLAETPSPCQGTNPVLLPVGLVLIGAGLGMGIPGVVMWSGANRELKRLRGSQLSLSVVPGPAGSMGGGLALRF